MTTANQHLNFNRNPDGDWMIYVLAALAIIIFSFLAFGCTTQRKATTYMNNHAYQAAKYCAAAFPVHDSVVYKQGQTITKSDTTYLQGDSVACPPVNHVPEAGKLVYVKCPPSRIIHDSIFKTDTVNVIRENTAKTAALTATNAIIQDKLISAENGRRNWRKWAILTWVILAVGCGGYLAAKFKLFI